MLQLLLLSLFFNVKHICCRVWIEEQIAMTQNTKLLTFQMNSKGKKC